MHSIFGLKHIIIVAVCALIIGVAFFFSRKMKLSEVTKILFYVGIISEIIKIFYYIVQNEDTHGGVLPKTDLPFHLCSIQIIFIAILNLSNNEKMKRILVSFMYPSCLVGGAAAILLATTSSLNGMWILTAQYFLYHSAIIVFALRVVSDKDTRLTVRDYTSCLKFLVLVMFFAFYINGMVYDGVSNINFMYVAGPPMSGLPFLNEEHGWLVYIIHYAFLVVFCVSVCYAKPIYEAVKKALSAKKSTEVEEEEKENLTV